MPLVAQPLSPQNSLGADTLLTTQLREISSGAARLRRSVGEYQPPHVRGASEAVHPEWKFKPHATR